MSTNTARLNLTDTALARIRRTLHTHVEENASRLRVMLGETPADSSTRGEIQGWLEATTCVLEAPEGTPIAPDGMAPIVQWFLLGEATRLVREAAYDAARNEGNPPPPPLGDAIQDLRRLVVADRKA